MDVIRGGPEAGTAYNLRKKSQMSRKMTGYVEIEYARFYIFNL